MKYSSFLTKTLVVGFLCLSTFSFAKDVESLLNLPLQRTSTEQSLWITHIEDYKMNIYYPETIKEKNIPTPFIIVLPGGNSYTDPLANPNTDYSNYGQELAKEGFIVVIPNLIGTTDFLPFPIQSPDQVEVVDIRNALIVLNSDVSSPLCNKIDVNKLGLSGHLLGGSIALLSLGNYQFPFGLPRPREEFIKAVGVYAGSTYDSDRPGVAFPVDQGGIPAALSVGEFETPVFYNDVLTCFDNMSNGDKSLFIIKDGERDSIKNPPSNATNKQINAHKKAVKNLVKFFRENLE